MRFPDLSLRTAENPPCWSRGVLVAFFVACGLWWLAIFQGEAARGEEATPDFNRDIRPILSHNCVACHGPDEHDRQAGLRLDDPAAAAAELESGLRAIVPGAPQSSEMIVRIREQDPDLVMPPPESHHVLDEAQKQLLERWIAAGGSLRPALGLRCPQGLAYAGSHRSGLATVVDRCLCARQAQAGAARPGGRCRSDNPRAAAASRSHRPAADTGRGGCVPGGQHSRSGREAGRRAAGIPRHAERLASWWLDLVRYADTVGYHGDQTHNASPYRDWVIHAFLENVPFDRFTLLQLAGDLVEPAEGEHPDDRVLASAYNRLLQTSHEGGIQVKEYRAIYQADRVRNISEVWLGATLGCAQCHDHKYDPLTSRDFYAMGAFFADIDDERHMGNAGFGGGTNTLPTTRLPERAILGPFDRGGGAVGSGNRRAHQNAFC